MIMMNHHIAHHHSPSSFGSSPQDFPPRIRVRQGEDGELELLVDEILRGKKPWRLCNGWDPKMFHWHWWKFGSTARHVQWLDKYLNCSKYDWPWLVHHLNNLVWITRWLLSCLVGHECSSDHWQSETSEKSIIKPTISPVFFHHPLRASWEQCPGLWPQLPGPSWDESCWISQLKDGHVATQLVAPRLLATCLRFFVS